MKNRILREGVERERGKEKVRKEGNDEERGKICINMRITKINKKRNGI